MYKQKVKHLLYEHQNNIAELEAERIAALKLAQEDHRGNELELRKDKRSLKVELKEQELANEDVMKNLKKVFQRDEIIRSPKCSFVLIVLCPFARHTVNRSQT